MQTEHPIDRRKFIRSSLLLAIAVTVPSLEGCHDDATPSADDDCLTTADILGPYYKAGAPFAENIIPVGNTAPPLIIAGNVFSHCDAPQTDAIVEIWNADESGVYDVSEQFLFRGRFKTGADGAYRFRTVIPGRYLNGSTYRPSHLHFRITAPGHRELVSQVYFKDDPFIEADPWAGTPQAAGRILAVGKDDAGTDTVTFDIHLNRA